MDNVIRLCGETFPEAHRRLRVERVATAIALVGYMAETIRFAPYLAAAVESGQDKDRRTREREEATSADPFGMADEPG